MARALASQPTRESAISAAGTRNALGNVRRSYAPPAWTTAARSGPGPASGRPSDGRVVASPGPRDASATLLVARRGRRRDHVHIHPPGGSARDPQAPESSARQVERPRDGAALQPRDGDDPAPSHPRGRAPSRRRLPARPRRADARRKRAAERRDVRLDLDGAAGREAHGGVLRQEHDRQGRVPADGRDRDAVREHVESPLERTRRRGGHRLLDDRVERSCDARRARAQAPLAARRAPRASRPTGRTSSWGSTSRSAGRSSPTTGTSRCGSCPWRATGSTSPPRRP